MDDDTRRHARSRGQLPAHRSGEGPPVVVAAVDASPTALRAASYAAGVARRMQAVLVLVHVGAPVGWPTMAAGPGYAYAAQPDAGTAPGWAMLRELAGTLRRDCGVAVEEVLVTGPPAREITRVATERHADAVVVGCSRSLLHRLVGSVSKRLVRRGAWPVMVVP